MRINQLALFSFGTIKKTESTQASEPILFMLTLTTMDINASIDINQYYHNYIPPNTNCIHYLVNSNYKYSYPVLSPDR
jgi:hypothetical protein